ncbi:BQ5605_C013g07201 [Microbotryum silenes-dioicae]|uniref:BQ5605_C013g07201 protein n=1 Tax=Microbotryum silenes-dioicae TaxID=796604 RepID=A0A2X0LVC8_9BASI|nr:BQ5605_C013g07201 [Microbotryum silenes-dioicae]
MATMPLSHDSITEKQPVSQQTSSGTGSGRTSLSNADREAFLQDALYPDDSYTANGTYWADLPNGERRKWINEESNKEALRELKAIGASAKIDPLAPLGAYFRKYVSNGMGLFVEGFVLFSIGNLQPLFAAVWPQCWGKTHQVCNKNLIASVTYLEIVGIIIGQLLVGWEADFIGRKFGLVQDAVVMLIGVIMLTSVWGATLQGWVIAYTISLFIYGIGVGGEYPTCGTRSIERDLAGPEGARDDRLHRGRNVVLAFLMQGWGQVFNQALLMLLLFIFHSGRTEPPYSEKAAQYTFRVSFGIIGLLHAWLAYFRYYHIKDADLIVQAAKKRSNVSGYDTVSLKLVCSHYWGRLIATAAGWFATDIFFYGNKVFQGIFIQIIKPGASLWVTWEYSLLNAVVSMCGYYVAAGLIDHKRYGRVRMQQIGFAFNFAAFLACAIWYDQLRKPGAPIKMFQFLYFMSSFFVQFGPNCTTFLVAAEVYPANVRGSAHGFSAASGKLGALVPTVLYNYIDNHTKFWFVPWFGLIGAVLTWMFLPDTTGLDLREQERYWQCVRSGHPEEYHGIAIHPRHLSWYERTILKRQVHYDPVQDRLDRIEELRILFESHVIAQNDESGDSDEVDHAFITPDVVKYFESEGDLGEKIQTQSKKERALHESAPDVRMRSKLHEQLE